jgi:hypothetical protein
MRTPPAVLVTAFLALIVAVTASQAADRQLSHAVYFKLKEPSPAAREALVAGCKKFLSGHEGTVYFAVGVLAEELNRDVNVRDFDVALYVVFANRAAHDRYQEHPRHLKFIEEFKPQWDSVRVFDAYLAAAEADRPKAAADRRPDPKPTRIAVPDAATSFAGMIEGQVVENRDAGVVVLVKKVARQWEHSKAKDPQALVGQRVLVAASQAGPVARFLASLKTGETVELDVAHREGERLVILELSAEQRKRAE